MYPNKKALYINRPDGVVGYHVSLTPIRSWDRAPVWSLLFVLSPFASLFQFFRFLLSFFRSLLFLAPLKSLLLNTFRR